MIKERKIKCFECWRIGVPPTWLVICGALLVQVGFGLYPVIVKEFASKNKADPLIFSFYRDLCCFPLLFLCAFIAERTLIFPRIKMLVVFMLLGLLGMFGNQLLYILGVYWAGPDIASAFQPIIPVWTTILAIATCTEKFPSPLHVHTWAKLIGILLATGGAIELTVTAPGSKNTTDNSTISLFDNNSNSTHHPVSKEVLGYVALFGNTFCMAIYVLIQKRFIFNQPKCRWKKHPIYVTAYSYFFGAFFMGLGTLYYVGSQKYDKFKIPEDSIYALVYAVFITSAMCYMLITWSNIHLSATIVTAFWPTQVLIAVVASYFITGDQLAKYQYIGVVMLILALFLVLFSNHMEERLQDGKSVLRVDCCMAYPVAEQDEEKKPLFPPRQMLGMMMKSLKHKIPKSLLLYFLVCIFGIGSWIAINGIWAEISILVISTPECEKLPAQLVVIIQVANIGPLLYTAIKYWICRCKKQHYLVKFEIGTIVILIFTGISSCVLLSFFWNLTLVISDNVYSVCLYIFTFFLALVDCTSSVVFIPFMRYFPSEYLSALYIGEGLSGLLPSLFALLQGSVNNSISCNGNYTGHEALGIRFSPNVYFLFLGGMVLFCGISFLMINIVPAVRKHVVSNKRNVMRFDNAIQRKDKDASDSSEDESQAETPTGDQSEGTSLEGRATTDQSKETLLSHTEVQFSLSDVRAILWSNSVLFICLVTLNFLINGALSAVSSFAFLPYGNDVYHIAVNLALLANPLMSFIFAVIPSKSKVIAVVMTVFVFVLGVYIIVMAQSPAPVFQAQLIGKIFIVFAYIAVSALATYTKLSIAVQLHHNENNDVSLFMAGLVTQFGSLLGAVLFFVLVNFTNLYTS